MTGVREAWLVAMREICERSRSRAFQASVAFLVVGVAAMLILPALLKPSSTRDVGVTGAAPEALAATIAGQAQAAGITARVHPTPMPPCPPESRPSARARLTGSSPTRGDWSGKPSPTSSSRPS